MLIKKIKKEKEIIFGILLISVFTSNYSLYVSPLRLINLDFISTLMKYGFIFSICLLLFYYILYLINMRKSKNNGEKLESFFLIINLLMILIIFKTVLYGFWLISEQIQSTSFLSFENNIKILLNLFLMLQIALYARTVSKLRIVFYTLSLSLILPTLLILIYDSSLIGDRIVVYQDIIFDGTIWNAANISFLTSSWLILYFFNFTESKFQRIFLILYFLIIFIVGITGSSRIVYLSIFVSSIPLIRTINRKIIRENLKGIIFISCILIVIFILFRDDISNSIFRFKQIFQSVHFNREPRIMIWSSYIKDFREYIFLGYFHHNPLEIHMGYLPHNIILNYFSRFGIIAPLLYLYLTIVILKNTFRSKKSELLISSLFMYIVSVMINQTGYIQPAFYIQLSLIYSLSMVSNRT